MKRKNIVIGDKPSSECLKYFELKISAKLSVGVFITVMTMFLSLSAYIVQNQRSLERKIDVLISTNPKAVKLMKDMNLSDKDTPKPSTPSSREDYEFIVEMTIPKKEYE